MQHPLHAAPPRGTSLRLARAVRRSVEVVQLAPGLPWASAEFGFTLPDLLISAWQSPAFAPVAAEGDPMKTLRISIDYSVAGVAERVSYGFDPDGADGDPIAVEMELPADDAALRLAAESHRARAEDIARARVLAWAS